MRRLSNRNGFALPMAILVIALLTAAIAAGFAATAGEAVTNNAQRAQERAYQLAQAGLEQFLVRRSESGWCTGCSIDPATADSEYTHINLTGGYADVVAYRVREKTTSSSPMFFIRSKGVDTTALLSGTGVSTYAERTVGVYANWNTTTIVMQGALTTLNGATVTTSGSASATVNGNNPSSTCPDYTDLDDDIVAPSGGGTSAGSLDVDDSMVLDTVAARTAISWNSIINEGALAFDYTIPTNSFPTTFTTWPIIRVKTNGYTIPTSGQGIIVADSDLVIPRAINWHGIILVGGKLTTGTGSTGSDSDIFGAVVTGLNHLTGSTSTTNDVIQRADIRYYGCYVANAGARLQTYSVLPNTWMDNVAIW